MFGRRKKKSKSNERVTITIGGYTKEEIQKIADETEKRLLNVDIIMEHIERGRIIEETISFVTKGLEEYLARKSNRKEIADIILGFYNNYTDKIFVWLTKSAEGYLSELISRPDTVENIWGAV